VGLLTPEGRTWSVVVGEGICQEERKNAAGTGAGPLRACGRENMSSDMRLWEALALREKNPGRVRRRDPLKKP